MNFFKKIILLTCLAVNINQSRAMIPATVSTGIIITVALVKCCLTQNREQLVITTEPIELINPDNRCYSNSLIQCLLQYPKFVSIERISELLERIEETDPFYFPLIVDNRIDGGNPFVHMIQLFDKIQINRESIEHRINPNQDGTKLTSYPELDLIVCPLKIGEQLSPEIEALNHEGSTYKLTGILCNTNDDSTFQHFYSYVNHNGLWFLCDDEKIINLSCLHEINSSEELISVIYNEREIIISYYTETTVPTQIEGYEEIINLSTDTEQLVDTEDLLETVRYNPNWIENFSRARTNIEKYSNPTPLMLFYKKEPRINRSRKRRSQTIRTITKRRFTRNDLERLREEIPTINSSTTSRSTTPTIEQRNKAKRLIKNEEIYGFSDLSRLKGLLNEYDIATLITPDYSIEGTELLSELGLEKLAEIIASKM